MAAQLAGQPLSTSIRAYASASARAVPGAVTARFTSPMDSASAPVTVRLDSSRSLARARANPTRAAGPLTAAITGLGTQPARIAAYAARDPAASSGLRHPAV